MTDLFMEQADRLVTTMLGARLLSEVELEEAKEARQRLLELTTATPSPRPITAGKQPEPQRKEEMKQPSMQTSLLPDAPSAVNP